MKKLCVGLFAAAFAFGAHAAAVDWDFYGWYEDVNGDPLEGTLSFYLGDSLLGQYDIVDYEVDTTISGVDVGTLKVVAEITNFSDGAGTLEYQYAITQLPFDGYPDVASSLSDLKNWVNAAVTDSNNIDLSAGTAANGYTPAGPTPPVIPEPTTGLLVLLGVAGLALRRRRA